MEVKINTKEKFHAITVDGPVISATMSDDLYGLLLPYLQNDAHLPGKKVKNVIVILKEIEQIDDAAAETLLHIQHKFYENNASFVICELQKPVEKALEKAGLLGSLNITPTESEAWDIVQMEEIEREFLDEEADPE